MQDKKKIFIETKEFIPKYGTEGSSGFDLQAYLPDGEVILNPGETKVISTGIKAIIPDHYEVQLRPRSGLAAKHGITLPNTPGTLDFDYRGDWGVILHNLSKEPFTITHGMRICQGVLAPVSKALFEEVEEVSEDTERGSGGFGSTGTH